MVVLAAMAGGTDRLLVSMNTAVRALDLAKKMCGHLIMGARLYPTSFVPPGIAQVWSQ